MKKMFYVLTALFVCGAMLLSACGTDTPPPPPTQDPAIAALQFALDELQSQIDSQSGDIDQLEADKVDLQEQLDEALKTPLPTEAPVVVEPTPTDIPEEPKYRCGVFVTEGRIYQRLRNRNGILQKNDAGNPRPDVLGERLVDWYDKGVRTCMYKKWVQFDGGRMFKLWYNTKNKVTGEWMSSPEDCCYVRYNSFMPDDASYILPTD